MLSLDTWLSHSCDCHRQVTGVEKSGGVVKVRIAFKS